MSYVRRPKARPRPHLSPPIGGKQRGHLFIYIYINVTIHVSMYVCMYVYIYSLFSMGGKGEEGQKGRTRKQPTILGGSSQDL